MKAQLRRKEWRADDGSACWADRVWFWCPACEDSHAIIVARWDGAGVWTWNGDVLLPDVNPSLLATGKQWPAGGPFHRTRHDVATGGEIRCHSFIRAGRWEFLTDSTHQLAGQTVEMVDLPDWFREAR